MKCPKCEVIQRTMALVGRNFIPFFVLALVLTGIPSLLLQVAMPVGSLLTRLAAADAISGERERATLEGLLLTPVARLGIISGKLLGALSLWLAAFVITIPYVWFLGRGVDLGRLWAR